MRKLNVKLLLALVLGAAAAAGAVAAVHAFQYQRIAAALLWQARRAEDAGKTDQMAHYLERYMEFVPQDGGQQARLGAVLAGDHFAGNRARRRQAFVVLSKAVARDAGRTDLQRLLVKTALEVGEYNAARRALETLAKAPGDPDPALRGELEGDWGRLLEAEKKPAEAVEHYRRAVKDAPADLDAYVRLAWLLRTSDATAAERKANAAEADQVVDGLVANNPTSARAHLARWRYRREFDLLDLRGAGEAGKFPVDKAAAEDVDAALGQAPEDVDALVAKADSEVLLEKGDRVHRDKAYEYLQQGLKLQAAQGYRAASDAGEFELLWHLGTLLLSDPQLPTDEKKMGEVTDVIARVRKTRGRPAAADYLEARLLVQKKEWAKALALLERARPALAAQAHSDLLVQIDLGLGQCFAALEEWPQAEASFQRVLDADKNSAAARAGLGTAQRVLGKYDQALDNLAQAAGASAEPGKAWLDVARLEIMRQLRQDKRDWSAAEDAIDRAAHALPRDAKEVVEPALLRAEILMVQGQADLAKTLLENARKAHPDRVEFWTALADLAARRGKPADALALLDEADGALHDRVELRVSRAFHLAADPTEAHLAALDALVKRDHAGFTADEQDRLLSGLAEAEIRAGRAADAVPLLTELAARPEHRSDLRLRLTLFDLALQGGEIGDVDKALTEIRDVEGGSGAYYELGRAMRLIRLARKDADHGAGLDEAGKALDRAAELQPDWSPVELARADAAELGGDPEGVITHLKEVVRLDQGQASPAVIQRLVEALNRRGRYAESQEYLGKLQQSLLAASPLGKLAIGVALNTGDVARAGQLLQAADLKDSKDFRDLLLRARLHEATNQTKEAEDDYRAAAAAEPGEPAVWVALVFFLANHDRTAEAFPLVEHDIPAKVTHDRAPLTVAQCYELLAMPKKADEAYNAALAARPDDATVLRAVTAYRLRTGRPADVAPLLERLIAAPGGDADWARRTLAVILAGGTDYRDFRRAAELVGLRIDANGVLQPDAANGRAESAEARRAKARVLSTQPQRQFRSRAIQLLEGLQSADPDDQYILAVLYVQDGDDARAADLLKHVAGLPDRAVQPAYLSRYIQLLMRQGAAHADQPDRAKLDEAGRQLARLEQLEKDRGKDRGAYGTVDLRAQLLEARGEGAQALDLLREYAKRPGAAPHDALLLMGSLGRQKMYKEAFDLCEKDDLWKACPPEVVGGVCEALLRQMGQGDEQRDRVEAWLKKAIADNPKATVLKMHLADLYDLRGAYPEAEAKYREVLDQEPGNVVALNNLAWLLAKQTGQGKQALSYIQLAVNGMGRRADLLDTRGEAELAVGDAQAAVTDFTEATADAPSAARLFHLARAQYEAHDRDAAVRTLQRARIDFDLQPAHLHPIEQQVCQSLLTELKIK